MDPHAIDALIHQCRTGQDAVKVYRAAVVAAGGEEPPPGASAAALLEVVRTSGWALLVAPELHAAYQEWQACGRCEDDLIGLRIVRDGAASKIEAVSADPLIYDAEGCARADLLPARIRAYASMAAEVTRAEEAYARARTRFVKSVYAYQRAMEPVRYMQPKELAKLILSQSYREGDLTIARAAIDEGQAALQSGSVDRVMSSLRSRLLDRSEP